MVDLLLRDGLSIGRWAEQAPARSGRPARQLRHRVIHDIAAEDRLGEVRIQRSSGDIIYGGNEIGDAGVLEPIALEVGSHRPEHQILAEDSFERLAVSYTHLTLPTSDLV